MRQSSRVIVGTSLAAVLTALPVFMIGALAFLIRQDFEFTRAQLGLSVGTFFLGSGIGSIPGGILAERFGGQRVALVSAYVSALCLVGLALLSTTWVDFVLVLGLAGLAHGVGIPAGHLALMQRIDPGVLGRAYGLRQAAIPTASLAAGLLIPLVALGHGWRPVYLVSASILLPVIYFVGPRRAGHPRRLRRADGSGTRMSPGRLLLIGMAAALGAAVGTASATFLVESVIAIGRTPSAGGAALAIASVGCILARATSGWAADRKQVSGAVLIASMLAIGAVGHLLLAIGSTLPVALIGSLLAFAGGWGWPAILNLLVVRGNQARPGRATGITQSGLFAGAVIGPLAFGLAVDTWSFVEAWLSCAAVAVVAAGTMARIGHRAGAP